MSHGAILNGRQILPAAGERAATLCALVATACLAGPGYVAQAAPETPQPGDLTRLSLEELMNVEVTLVSKRAEKVSQSPAAIYVISQDEIRRSGALTIPDALRLAPGMNVAQGDAHDWAISARGFNDVFANKLLVMVDGRSVYTPLFSGTSWDLQDMLLEDLDRIEIIRGPGAALWGANAVNGVINIISKSAKDTQGVLIMGGAGSEERDMAGVRYGVKVGDASWLRVYGKYFDREGSRLTTGAESNDEAHMGRGGFRLDWEPSMAQAFTFQGDFYAGQEHQTFVTAAPTPPFTRVLADDFSVMGGNFLGRWTQVFSEDSDLKVQAYYDRTSRSTAIFQEDRDTVDLDVQQRVAVGERHEFLFGIGYRLSHDNIGNTYTLTFNPDDRYTQLASAFAQDQITLVKDRLRLTLGTRFEHNDFTGFEVQPSARLLWTPDEKNTFWAAISRAVRTPSRAESDVRINQPGPFPGTVASTRGNPNFESETLIAYELGYRAQPRPWVSLDLSLFYNNYDHLRSAEPGAPIPGVPVVIPVMLANNLEGETYGAEFGPQFQLASWWRLQLKYSYLRMDLRAKPGSGDTANVRAEGNSPRQQFSIHSAMDFPHDVELDATLGYVDGLPNLAVPAYWGLGLRLAWRPVKNLELSVVGQSLLDNQHPEFGPTSLRTPATEIERSVYGKVTWRF